MPNGFNACGVSKSVVGALIDKTQPYHLPDNFYPLSSFLKTKQSRLIGEGFIGRKRYLIQMRQAFRAGRHVCLHGLGGLGKTTLAEAFAHNYDNHSHTTVIFRNGSQINEAHILNTLNKRFAKINSDLAEQIQQAIDDPQTDVLDKLQLLIDNYLNGRKTILIFDNVEDVQMDAGGAYQRSIGSESLSAFLRHLCHNTPKNCHIIFTTRYKIEDLADVVEHLALDKMGYAEQYRLLNYSQILRGIPLQDRDDVYKRLDGHPRGYEYLEALLKHDKTFSWQQVSKAEGDVFENLLLAKVYERLTESEKAIFQMVSVFIARTPLAALAAVSGENEADLLPILQSLQDWSLCFLEKEGQFEVHRLTREWMAQNVTLAEKVEEWALKAGEYFHEQSDFENLIFLELAKEYYEIAEEWQLFMMTFSTLVTFYNLKGFNDRILELNQIILSKNIDEETNSKAIENIGHLNIKLGFYEEALASFEHCLKIHKKSIII
ncbi:MAG: AAA family ATPase [Saprospiraceae bacterium]|nr:AAA family ATPase [Saprospiraceae bacterium]